MKKIFMSLAVIATVALGACSGSETNPEEVEKNKAAKEEAAKLEAEAKAAEEAKAKEEAAVLSVVNAEGQKAALQQTDSLYIVTVTVGEGEAAKTDSVNVVLTEKGWILEQPAEEPAAPAKKK